MNNGQPKLDDLEAFAMLSPELRRLVAASFTPAAFAIGSDIVREGDDADAFYVLASGMARVVKQGMNGDEVPLGQLRQGDSFGEAALLNHSKRTATVRASSAVEAFKLDGSIFRALIENHPEIRGYLELQAKSRSLSNFFRVYTPFTRLPVEALTLLLANLETVTHAAGDLVIGQGDQPGPMYVVEEGRLRVFIEVDGRRRYVGYLRKGDFFGEVSLLKNIARTASVEAVSACRLLRLNQTTFARLVADYPAFEAQLEERMARYDYKKTARLPLDFAEELLPADASTQEKVGPRQVDKVESPVDRGGPFASADGRFKKRPSRIRRFPHLQQIDEMDCGAACLGMVCRYYGRSVSLARIRQVVHTATDGTSLRGLRRGAEALGLAARAVKAPKSSLPQMPLPAIVHWEGNHWIVLYDVAEKWVRVADPATGHRRLSRAEFDQKWSGYAALFDYTEEFEKAPESKPTIGWLWPFFRPFLGIILKSIGLAAIVSVLQMALPVFTQVIVDRVLVDRDVGLLHGLIFAMLALLVFMTAAMLIQRYLLSFVAVRVDSATLDFLTRRLLVLPMSYFATRRTGDIQRRLAGIRQVREFLVQNGVNGLTALCQIAAAVLLMFVYSPLLALVFLAAAPLYAGLMRFSSRKLKPIFDELEEAYGKYHSHQIDAIKGVETVKALGAESGLRERMLAEFHGLARRQFKANFIMMGYDGTVQIVTFLSLVLFLFVGAQQVMQGGLTIGALVAFNSLVALANAPIITLLTLWDNLQMSSVLLNRLNDIFETEPEQGRDHSRLTVVRSLEGGIRFQNLGFQYGGPESAKILEGISFDVPPGKTIAIVGRSGSGKTTLIKCLAGLLEPTEGAILFDGLDMKKLDYRSLRRKVGFVLQENYLFDDTIARNIAFGEEEPDMERVLWAARVANAHEFVERLPLGYDTRVGETGIAISGGQRQRIAIARAIYNQPPVLLFDEATSALDTESEKAVKENLGQLLEGRTSFVIAHRLSTIRDADVILVLEKGKLAEHGSHEELLARRGLYYYLSSQQLGF
jgi:HlyB family type I secretion system ABC transporter